MQGHMLVLVSLNPDRSDIGGNSYPQQGFISAKNYQPNMNVMYGLYGTKDGKFKNCKWLNPNPKACWAVAKVEQNDEVITLDSYNNFIKFKQGIVVHSASKEECNRYIAQQLGYETVITPDPHIPKGIGESYDTIITSSNITPEVTFKPEVTEERYSICFQTSQLHFFASYSF